MVTCRQVEVQSGSSEFQNRWATITLYPPRCLLNLTSRSLFVRDLKQRWFELVRFEIRFSLHSSNTHSRREQFELR